MEANIVNLAVTFCDCPGQGGQHMSARSPGRAALRDTVFPIGGIGGADRMGFWLERCRDIPGE